MPYDIDFPDGKNIQLDKISDIKEGKFVEIQGIVDSVEMIQTARGAGSKVVIKDLSNENHTVVFMPFVNILVYGLEKGCYCNLNGDIAHGNPYTGDKTIILIDRLKLKSSLNKSWRIAFLNLASPNYYCWPKNLNMSWSISLDSIN